MLSEKHSNKTDKETKYMIKHLTSLCKYKAKNGGHSIIWYTNSNFDVDKLSSYFKNEKLIVSYWCEARYKNDIYKHCIKLEW